MAYSLPFACETYTYEQALDRIHNVLKFGICPMLETVEDMLEELGNPDLCFKSIQLAGTNGKTSTSRFTAALLKGEGYKTALYTSPHLVEYPERMEVNGKALTKEDFAFAIAAADMAGKRVNAKRKDKGLRPYDITEFDLLTVAASVAFARAEVDVCVLECGMGGRWDATSALKSIETVCVTGVGLDHMKILGDTKEKIAHEKAAIIKPDRKVVLGPGLLEPETVLDVFLNQCKAVGSEPLIVMPESLSDVSGLLEQLPTADEFSHVAKYHITKKPKHIGDSLSLNVEVNSHNYNDLNVAKPHYQATNVAVAVCLSETFLGRALNIDRAKKSLIACPTPGRFDVCDQVPLHMVDACHNPQSVDVFLASLAQIHPQKSDRPALLCAALADKDVKTMVEQLAPEFSEVYVTKTSSPRALDQGELAHMFEEKNVQVKGIFSTVEDAVQALQNINYIALGSITLAGEVVQILRQHA